MTLNILPLLDIDTTLPKPYTPKLPMFSKKTNPHMLLDGFTINTNLKFIKKIGAGTYGLIYLMEDSTTGQQFAAKIILKNPPVKSNSASVDVNENKKYIQKKIFEYFNDNHGHGFATSLNLKFIEQEGGHCPFLREIALHLKVHNHPNVISIHKVLNLDNMAVVILMDYFEQGDLFHNIIDKQIFKPSSGEQGQLLMKNCMLQLIDALDYCSSQSIYHCDLKPENVMVRYNPDYKRKLDSPIIDYDELHIVLIDFGLAMSLNLICCNACRGSSFYMAPERIVNFNTNNLIKSMIDMNQYQTIDSPSESSSKYFPTLAGDIWSLGVLFINITCARNPWPIANINDDNQVFSNYIFRNKKILSSILPISNQFNKLLDKIFALNPNDRISLHGLHHYVTICDFFNNSPTQDGKLFNGQLYTPPDTESDAEYESFSEESCFVTPEGSFVQMEQCKKNVKIFGCPYHHHHHHHHHNPH